MAEEFFVNSHFPDVILNAVKDLAGKSVGRAPARPGRFCTAF